MLMILTPPQFVEAQTYGRYKQVRTTIELGLTNPAGLSPLRAAFIDASRYKPTYRPVSDLMLIINGDGADADALMRRPDGPTPQRSGRLFRASLFAVIGGRIHRGAAASCGGWRGGVSQCVVDCEGGGFRIVRDPSNSGNGLRLQLVIETAGSAYALDGRDGPSLVACSFEQSTDIRLRPVSGRTGFIADFTE